MNFNQFVPTFVFSLSKILVQSTEHTNVHCTETIVVINRVKMGFPAKISLCFYDIFKIYNVEGCCV